MISFGLKKLIYIPMEDTEFQPRKNWWDRNWKWFVPTGCLSLVVLCGLVIAGIFWGITSILKGSDSYKTAMNEVQHNKIVIEKLGSPIQEDGIASGSVNINNNVEHCDLQIPIKGSKEKAILYVVATKRGTWKYNEMTVYIEKTKEEIDLLKK